MRVTKPPPRSEASTPGGTARSCGLICFVEEVPAAISQGETLGEVKANLLDALKLVLECQRELGEKDLSPNALRETFEFVEG
jgi:predicted RNase H-like HicB family nuclease